MHQLRRRSRRLLLRILLGDQTPAIAATVMYVVTGAAWIAFSDRLLERAVQDPARISQLQTYKGWFFVLASAALLYAIVQGSLWLRRRALRRQRQSEKFMERLMGNLPGVAYRCRNDEHWTMEYVSDGLTELTGYRPDDLVHNATVSWEELIHPADREGVRRGVEEGLRRRGRFQLEYRIRTASGQELWVWEQGCPVYDEEGELLRLEGFIADTTDRKRAEEALLRRQQDLESLRQIDLAILGSLDLRVSVRTVLEEVTSRLDVDAADILVLHPGSENLEFVAGRGFRTDALRHTRLRLDEGPAGTAAAERRRVMIPDLTSVDAFADSAQLVGEDFVSYIAVPLVAKGTANGVLEVFHRSPLDPEPEWLPFLDSLAGQAAIAVESARLFERLQRTNRELRRAYDETIEGWARALDLRDQETEGHSRRVAELTVRLGRRLGLQDEALVHLRRGALLHDIGKVAVPDAILHKPGELTEEEWRVMQKHPEYAYRLLSPIEYLRPALEIPYGHHERWDGSGYPRALAGDQIPLAARIFAVVDVWDALRSERPYRSAWSEERVREYLRDRAGSLFDPDVVHAFLQMEPDVLVQAVTPPAGTSAQLNLLRFFSLERQVRD